MTISLIDEVNMRLAELQAMASYSSADYERDKWVPNSDLDGTQWEDDDFSWSRDE